VKVKQLKLILSCIDDEAEVVLDSSRGTYYRVRSTRVEKSEVYTSTEHGQCLLHCKDANSTNAREYPVIDVLVLRIYE
jgi:hypothetical protein